MVDTSSGRKVLPRRSILSVDPRLEAGIKAKLQPKPELAPLGPSLTAYNPSLRDKIGYGISDALRYLGMPKGGAADLGHRTANVADFVPPIGLATSVDDLSRAKGGPAVMEAALGLVPGGRGVGAVEKKVASTLGDLTRPAVTRGGLPVAEWQPHDFGLFGREHGVPRLGPASTENWNKGLKTFKGANGQEFSIHGGLDGTEKLTYYDLLHLKSQAINPNDLAPSDRMKLHHRLVNALEQEGGPNQMQKLNQLIFGMVSPNQPLTPNELAMASAMVKTPEDLDKLAGFSYRGANQPPSVKDRQQRSNQIAEFLGVHAGPKGGTGHSGSADYTRIADMAHMYRENPEFFRYKGTAEGGANDAENWANYVDRLSSQVPGLSAKTGSLAGVFEAPSTAAISAVDRHMLNNMGSSMFPDEATRLTWEKNVLADFNKNSGKNAKTLADMRSQGGTGALNDAYFGYLNRHPEMKYRLASGEVNPKVPQHLRGPWIQEPQKVQTISAPYRKVLANQADVSKAAGDTGTFSGQWRIWDEIRNRTEPHEALFPGLEQLPRQSHQQIIDATGTHKGAGYMANTEKKVDPVTGDVTSVMRPVRKVLNPSQLAYWGVPAAIGGGALMNMPDSGGGQAAASPGPFGNFHSTLTEQAVREGVPPVTVLRRLFGTPNQ